MSLGSFREPLVLLRELNLGRFYFSVLWALFETQEGVREATDEVASECDRLRGDKESVFEVVRIAEVMKSREYAEFLDQLADYDDADGGSVAEQVHGVLTRAALDQELTAARKADYAAYVDSLREISSDELRDALVAGTIVNAVGLNGEPEPIRSDEDSSGAFLDEDPTPTAKVDGRTLVAVLNEFCSGGDEFRANPQGLRLNRVVITHGLNLNWINSPFPIGFEGCHFLSWVDAAHLRVPQLSFDSCDFTAREHAIGDRGAFNGAQMVVGADLRFSSCRRLDQVFILEAAVGTLRLDLLARCSGWSQGDDVRFVTSGAHFGQVILPEPDEAAPREIPVYLPLRDSISIGRLRVPEISGTKEAEAPEARARAVLELIARPTEQERREAGAERRDAAAKLPRIPAAVLSEVEAAIRRSGEVDVAQEFGIAAAEYQTRHEGLKGSIKRIALGPTVRYFYDNLRALWGLLILLGLTWMGTFALAMANPATFGTASADSPVVAPHSWLAHVVDRLVWSLLYATDVVLSPLSLGQVESMWPQSVWAFLLLAVVKCLSLILLALFAIGATGLAEQRSAK